MKKNYLIFPMKVMGITQTYDGKTSHYISSHGTPADYPIDIAGKDTGREPFYCPCDEMEVVKIAGDVTGNNHANGAWLVLEHETKTKLEGFPDGFELAKPHKYGDTAITVLKYTAGTGE